MSDPAATLAQLRARGLLRTLRTVESAQGPRVRLDGRLVLLLCSNDYLSLAAEPAVRAAAGDAAERWGAGAGASRLVSGTMAPHAALEQELAEFKGHPRALLFGSGYLANVGVIGALTGPDELVLSDALNHASIVDGCRLSQAETVVYPHGDLDALASALRHHAGRPATVVTDAVFSMDGDLAPLAEIVALAERHGARVIVDEAHATGVVGPGGRGLVASLGLEERVDVVIGTLGKALGSYGAFACCAGPLADLLINRARTFIFSTALPPPSVAAARAALQILVREPERVETLRARARGLRTSLAARGLDVAIADMPIVPLVLGAAERALAASTRALDGGVFAQAIRPPTVPEGSSRLRLTACAGHSAQELDRAAGVLAAACASPLD